MMTVEHLLTQYEELAALTRAQLDCTRHRDWEAYASLLARERYLLNVMPARTSDAVRDPAVLGRIAGLIEQMLSDQAQMQALLGPWQAEVAGELNSAVSSRKLAGKYGQQAAP